MITFSEFLTLAERYYEPDEPLPSGKTPYGKAVSSAMRQRGKSKRSPENTELGKRVKKQLSRLGKEVLRGADNPNMDLDTSKSPKEYDFSGSHEKGLKVHDTKNKIVMDVSRQQGSNWEYEVTKDDKPVYTVTWDRTGPYARTSMGTGRSRNLLRNVKKMWDNEVVHRLPHGAVLTNSPVENKTSTRNTRSNLYRQHAGFGEVGQHGRQFAEVGREPSPKQKAKGGIRTRPVSSDIETKNISTRQMSDLDQQREPKDLEDWTDRSKPRKVKNPKKRQ
jgi:hypothetical protein